MTERLASTGVGHVSIPVMFGQQRADVVFDTPDVAAKYAKQAIDALPAVIDGLRRAGFSFMTAEALTA